MRQLVLFASGKGSNVQAIIDYFHPEESARVALIVTNNPKAGVLEIAERHGVPVLIIDRALFSSESFIETIRSYDPSLLVLAGFLWKVPDSVTKAFEGQIVNIHPSLLPKYGGKGMYGQYVHEKVLAEGDKETGITIHYVNEHYDEGAVVLQAYCPVHEGDDALALAERIHRLEHYFFPRTIEFLIQ